MFICLRVKKKYPKRTPGKWKHGCQNLRFPVGLILTHTQQRPNGRKEESRRLQEDCGKITGRPRKDNGKRLQITPPWKTILKQMETKDLRSGPAGHWRSGSLAASPALEVVVLRRGDLGGAVEPGVARVSWSWSPCCCCVQRKPKGKPSRIPGFLVLKGLKGKPAHFGGPSFKQHSHLEMLQPSLKKPIPVFLSETPQIIL